MVLVAAQRCAESAYHEWTCTLYMCGAYVTEGCSTRARAKPDWFAFVRNEIVPIKICIAYVQSLPSPPQSLGMLRVACLRVHKMHSARHSVYRFGAQGVRDGA